MAEISEINVSNVMHTVTLKVTGRKRLAVRGWLCGQLMKLAAIALGSKLSVELVDEEGASVPGERRYVKVGDYMVPTAASAKWRVPYTDTPDWARRVDVLLDGKVQTKVIGFDMDAGWVERYKTDENGELDLTGGDTHTEVLRGKVELVPSKAGAE